MQYLNVLCEFRFEFLIVQSNKNENRLRRWKIASNFTCVNCVILFTNPKFLCKNCNHQIISYNDNSTHICVASDVIPLEIVFRNHNYAKKVYNSYFLVS